MASKSNGTGTGGSKMLQAATTAAFGQQSNISKKSKFRYLLFRSENHEKQIVELLQSMSAYVRRTAKLRDAGDTLAETLNNISNSEILNPSAKQTIGELSKTFRVVQDHRDSEILFMEDKLLPMISEYGTRIKKQREELRTGLNKLFDGKSVGGGGGGLSWIGGTGGTNRRSRSAEHLDRKGEKSLQQTIQRWELKKNMTFKKILLKLILSELRFNIRSFNNFTYIYKHILDEMNPRSDLEFFNEFLQFRSLKNSQLQSLDDDDGDGDSSSDSDDDDEDDDEDVDDDDDDDDQDFGHDHSTTIDDNSFSPDNSMKSETKESPLETRKEDRKSSGKRKPSIIGGENLKRYNSTPEISSDLAKNQLALFTRKSTANSSKLVANLFGKKKSEGKNKRSSKTKKEVLDCDENNQDDQEDSDSDDSDLANGNDHQESSDRRRIRVSSARNPPPSWRHR